MAYFCCSCLFICIKINIFSNVKMKCGIKTKLNKFKFLCLKTLFSNFLAISLNSIHSLNLSLVKIVEKLDDLHGHNRGPVCCQRAFANHTLKSFYSSNVFRISNFVGIFENVYESVRTCIFFTRDNFYEGMSYFYPRQLKICLK